MMPNYNVGDEIIITGDTNGFDKGVVAVITDIQIFNGEEPLYITKHSNIWGVNEQDFKLNKVDWKKRIGDEE